MRAMITHALSQDGDIEVIGTAGNPNEARSLIKELNPDVLTLDVEMPGMNGLDFLDKIMRLRPMPVVMVSTLTGQGAEASIRALELGAFDCLAKPAGGLTSDTHYGRQLADMVKAAARSIQRPRLQAQTRAVRVPASYQPRPDALIAIGASTGGVEALIEVLSDFPENCPPTVIVQHMPPTFTTTFAARLNRLSRATVAEAVHGAPLLPGHVYLAPGGLQHLEVAGNGPWRCRLVKADLMTGHRPSVDWLFRSVAKAAAGSAVGAILTGMGGDGAEGLKEMRQTGAFTVGQDEDSCVVYGMPAVAKRIGAVELQLPLSRIAQRLLQECQA
jgi:two-component system chemotaxis response regulator CheB